MLTIARSSLVCSYCRKLCREKVLTCLTTQAALGEMASNHQIQPLATCINGTVS